MRAPPATRRQRQREQEPRVLAAGNEDSWAIRLAPTDARGTGFFARERASTPAGTARRRKSAKAGRGPHAAEPGYPRHMTDEKPLKSALDLAMERFRKSDEAAGVEKRPLTDAQKAAIGEA